MYNNVVWVILVILLASSIKALDAKTLLNATSGTPNVGVDKTTLKVALYPYIPDSAGDKFANPLRFIEEEFNKIQPDINLQLRPLTQNEDFYS
jgi:hypothetical protein